MIITDYKTTKKQGRVNIYLDGEYSFTVFVTVASEYGLDIGTELSPALVDEILKRDEKVMAKTVAMNCLARSAYSVKGLKKKLDEKKLDPKIITETINYLIENGYLDDKKFAESSVEYYHEIKYYGKNRIMQILYQKGVPATVIEDVCESYFNDDSVPDILGGLIDIFIKKYDLSDIPTKNKVINKLFRMGYDFEEIKSKLKEKKYDIESED